MMRSLLAFAIGIVSATISVAAEDDLRPEDLDFFEKRVRPILVERCFECHSSDAKDKLRGGLQLDSREAILKGGDTGPAAAAGKPDESLLIEAIRYDSQSIEMPPSGKIPDAEIAVLTEWVRRGLPFPQPAKSSATGPASDWDARRSHWSFQPLRSSPPLTQSVPDDWRGWARTRTDQYVLDEQLERGFHPSPEASRRVLIRRLKLDLLGLPPTSDEIQSFESDPSLDAYEQLVDRYLASPHYGERWGRHWLDLTRYCDVAESWREGIGQPWLYRDWVIGAWNDDLPYERFVRQQFAADLLPGAKPEDNAALGFLGLSPTYWKELKLDHLVIKQVVAEEWEERIEAISGTFLGLTMACARCHDHKFDPISMRDYYGLAGVLASVRIDDRPIIPSDQAEKVRAARQTIKELEKEKSTLAAKKPASDEDQKKLAEFDQRIAEIRQATPGFDEPEACGIVDASLQVLPDGAARTKLEFRDEPQNVAMQIRGNAAKSGPIVPRGFPAVFTSASPRLFEQGSGRLELADAIVTDAAPLASRVIVNRIWKHHFGRGIVSTASNFGLQGDPPTHPELLDDLAQRFIANGWSMKWLHREILLSATYRQSSQSSLTDHDPDNTWLTRMPLRRLDVEAWRDSMLAATGELDLQSGGPPLDLTDPKNRRRTIYGRVTRRELADILRLHDFPDPVAHVATREPTTTPLQQLFVLNSPLLRARSTAILNRPDVAAAAGDSEKIRVLVSAVFAREAAPDEEAACKTFLSAAAAEGLTGESAWLELAQSLLASNELLFTE